MFSDHLYVSYHISLENWHRKDLKTVLESCFNMLIRKVSLKTVAFSSSEKLKKTKRDIFYTPFTLEIFASIFHLFQWLEKFLIMFWVKFPINVFWDYFLDCWKDWESFFDILLSIFINWFLNQNESKIFFYFMIPILVHKILH